MKITFREAQAIKKMVDGKLFQMLADLEWSIQWAKEHDQPFNEDAELKEERETLASIKAKLDSAEV